MSEQNSKNKKHYLVLALVSIFLFLAVASVFTIAQSDTQEVIIENVSAYTLDSSVIIYWDTNILADSLVKYGLSQDNLTEKDYLGVHSVSHASEIYGLIPNTLYYFRVNSTNANGNSNESEVFTFTTLEDNVSPTYSNLSSLPESGNIYEENRTYTFRAEWKDNGIIESVSIIHNFKNENIVENVELNEMIETNETNNETNETISNATIPDEKNIFIEESMNRINGTDIYEYSVSDLNSGNYTWMLKAKDASGNEQSTEEFVYIVNKSSPKINVSLDEQEVSEGYEYKIEQRSFVNISGVLYEKDILQKVQVILSNSSGIINQTESNELDGYFNMIHYFEHPGIHNLTVIYDESLNYISKTQFYTLNISPIEIGLFTDNPEYNLGEGVNYVVLAPNSSNLSVEVCGPLPTGAGFVECKNLVFNQENTYPYTNIGYITNKTGNYRVRAQITYKGLTKYSEKNYTVVNNMQVNISGDNILKIGETSSLVASASGGVGTIKYNWTLSNGTKITGQNLNVKYNSPGSYPVVLSVNDDAGNYKTTTVTLVVKKYYIVKVLVVDNADNSIIESARVRMDRESETTDSDGYAEFELIEGDYDLRVSRMGYSSYVNEAKSDSNKTITVKLAELEPSADEPLEITLRSPLNDVSMNTKSVLFEAYVDLGGNTNSTCMFFVAEDNNEWYRVMKTVLVNSSETISHSEEFAGGKYFAWKVQCESTSKTYSSSVWKFVSVTNEDEAELRILEDGTDEIIDAGEIRRRIEVGLTNLDKMDMESKKDADALKFSDEINEALRDYERAMRDISNIKYRKDLSETEQEAKKLEYYNQLKNLEKNVPLDVKNLGYETFISYPTKEDLINLSKQYQTYRNIVGKASETALSQLQNGIVVTTRISNVEITYINGNKQVITLVIKKIKITDNSTDTFILEYIPKEFASSSKELMMLPDEVKVVNEDPVLKIDKQEELIYYVVGEKDISLGKETKSILLSDNIFTTRNAITGDVTFSSLYEIDFTSPTSLIILIIIISGVYLIYAFDIFGGLFEKSRRKWKEQRINKINELINDAKDLLQKGELTRANLLFKEIQLTYEDSPEEIRGEVYNLAIELLDLIDSTQLEMLIINAEKNSNGLVSVQEKEKITESRLLLKESYALLSDSLRSKYGQKIELLSDEATQKEGAGV